MATTALTAANFEQTVSESPMVIVDFWAGWCQPCMRFAPVFEEASEDDANSDIVFAKVDTEAEQQLSGVLQITSIPTIMAFKEGVLVFNQAGALPKAALEDIIGQLKGLDMGPVKEQIAKQQAEQGGTDQS